MSEILFEAAAPADLTVFARTLAAAEIDPLVGVLPNRTITGFRTKSVKVSRTTTAAKFRSFDAETPIGKRPVAAIVKSLELAPLGQKLPLFESEILGKYLASVANGGSADQAAVAELVAAAYDDTENNVSAVLNRALQLRGEFLFSGALSIAENGFIQEADFGLPADHDLAVGDLAAAWDNGGDALTDELNWIAKVQEDASEQVVAAVMSSKVARSLLTNTAYVAAAGNLVERVSPAERDRIRAEYNLPPIVICDAKVGGTRVTPEDKIALATATVGEFQWGDTAEGLQLLGAKSVETASVRQPKIVASAWLDNDPVTLWTKANATGLVVAGDINGLFVAEVLSGAVAS